MPSTGSWRTGSGTAWPASTASESPPSRGTGAGPCWRPSRRWGIHYISRFISRTLFVTYSSRIFSEMKSVDAERNVQKNTIDSINWRDQNQNIYNIYSKKKTSRNEK